MNIIFDTILKLFNFEAITSLNHKNLPTSIHELLNIDYEKLSIEEIAKIAVTIEIPRTQLIYTYKKFGFNPFKFFKWYNYNIGHLNGYYVLLFTEKKDILIEFNFVKYPLWPIKLYRGGIYEYNWRELEIDLENNYVQYIYKYRDEAVLLEFNKQAV